MIKIYDCSNSNERPAHRGNGCPVENDIIGYLKKYAYQYNCLFVDNPKECDIIITNDVFPSDILKLDKPKIKRMDGVYWCHKYVQRNEPLNRAAQLADHVIFISNYSKDSYFKLYNVPLKDYSVCLNQADPSIYNESVINNDRIVFVSTASSWERDEKRCETILNLAEMIEEKIILIGKPPLKNVPNNIILAGYCENPIDIAATLKKGNAFLNFSYRDAAPKTVCQALNCGLPVLYANSGGVPEIVEDYGIGITDEETSLFEEFVPQINNEVLYNGYLEFKNNYNTLRKKLVNRNKELKFQEMIDGYFNQIIKFA